MDGTMRSGETTSEKHVAFAMGTGVVEQLFPMERSARFRSPLIVDPVVMHTFEGESARRALARVQILITSWGCPPIDDAVLDLAPELEAVVHAGGSVKGHVSPSVWERGIVVTTAASANAIPVAEFTLAQILLANKHTFQYSRRLRAEQRFDPDHDVDPEVGNYGKRVGVVGASHIGRRVMELLRPFDLEVVVADPYLTADGAAALEATLVSLAELVASSDVVSLHAPALPETRHLIDRELIGTMKVGSTLINTARGSLVDQQALTDRLVTGTISAVLDVTDPWIPLAGDRLYGLTNVLLTPHIAGSLGTELHRLADLAHDEAVRIASGMAPLHPVSRSDLARIA
jgi:phosphoglycerate dehydrogenase-like enzyme